jgi:hypothetical protein
MKWRAKDAELYLQSKEYIDTAVIPLVSVQVGTNVKSVLAKGEYTLLVTEELERQLRGRIFLFPSSTYLNQEEALETIKQLYQAVRRVFPHVVFLTAEDEWDSFHEEFHVIPIPPVPLEDLSPDSKKKIVQEQIEKILNILLQYWNGS